MADVSEDFSSRDFSGMGRTQSAFDPRRCYRVKFERENGKLGIAYRAADKGLVITGIVIGSPVDQWNQLTDADRMVCVGDVIKRVNGATMPTSTALRATCAADCEPLAKELVNAGTSIVRLVVERFGPRWHVEGITAECMQKIHKAEEAGMHLELVMPDELVINEDEIINESDLKCITKRQLFIMTMLIALPSMITLALVSAMGLGFDLFGAFAGEQMNDVGNLIIMLFFSVLVGMYIVDWHKWDSKIQRGVTLLVVIYGTCVGGLVKCRFYPQAPMVILLFHIPVLVGILRATAFRGVNRSSFYRGVALSTLLVGLGVLAAWLAWMNIPGWDGVNRYDDSTKAKLVEKSAKLYEEFTFTVNGAPRSLDYDWDCKDINDIDFDLVYGTPVANGHLLTLDEKAERTKRCGQVNLIWFLLWLSPFVVVMTNLVISVFCAINGIMTDVSDVSRAEKALKQFVLMVFILFFCMWVAASVAGASMRLTGTLMAFCGAALIALFIWLYFEVGARLVSATLKSSKFMRSLIGLVTNDWFRAGFLMIFGWMLPGMLIIEVMKQKVRRLRGASRSSGWLTREASVAIEFFRAWRWTSIFIKVNWLAMLYWTVSVGVAKVTVVFLSWLNQELESVPFVWVCVIFFFIGYTMFLLPPVPGIPVYITSGIILAAQARNIPEIGYVGGILIATALSFVLKLAAVCGQYSIGYFMGKSVKIQQLVMVDKVPTRSIEKILLGRGLKPGKVAVLVGGPDWPTSVLCGILKLNLFQCCLGTMPVIIVSTPCVLAGAFMTGPEANLSAAQKNVWDALANTAIAVSALGQLASGVLAMYFIQDTIGKHSEELSLDRVEHIHVKALTEAEQDYNDCYSEIIDWKQLPKFWLGMISLSAVINILTFGCFLLMDEVLFEEFQVKDSIGDPEGLDCGSSFACALKRLVRNWMGWCVLGVFGGACCIHFIFLRFAARKTKMLLADKEAAGLLSKKPVDNNHDNSSSNNNNNNDNDNTDDEYTDEALADIWLDDGTLATVNATV